jgi:hypothetical protein
MAATLMAGALAAASGGDPAREFGAQTRGGLEGRAIRVTTLEGSGPGSLREALETEGPRLVVFEVGGVIDLQGRSLAVRHPHLTLAGQTAPDPGVTLIRGGLVVETHDVVIQHLAVRPGDGAPPGVRPWEPDALGVRRGPGGPAHDVLFEHCSATWAVDENLSTSGPADVTAAEGLDATAHDLSLRRCLVAEGLSRATHGKGEHSKGTLVHDGVRGVAVTGSLFAHNRERNPRLKGGTRTLVAGNVMYNWGTACVGMGARGNRRELDPAEAVVAGNLALAGPDTRARLFVKAVDPPGRVFLLENVALDAGGAPLTLAGPGLEVLPRLPEWARDFAPSPAWTAAERALRSAGARPARRDPIDARIVRSVIEGTGRIIDSQEEVGGYPERPATRRPLEVPEGAPARARWLQDLSASLAEDTALDLAPLRRRLAAAGRSK